MEQPWGTAAPPLQVQEGPAPELCQSRELCPPLLWLGVWALGAGKRLWFRKRTENQVQFVLLKTNPFHNSYISKENPPPTLRRSQASPHPRGWRALRAPHKPIPSHQSRGTRHHPRASSSQPERSEMPPAIQLHQARQ